MIQLNLLDEKDIPKDELDTPEKGKKKSKGVNWFVLGPCIGGLLYILFMVYYFVGVKGPLGDVSDEYRSMQSEFRGLEPKVKEHAELTSDLSKLQLHYAEFVEFRGSKKNWAKVLNILSNELPDEVVFASMNSKKGKIKRKEKTKKGLVTEVKEADILSIELKVPEQYQSKIAVYIKKLEKHDWLSKILLSVDGGDLSLREGVYNTRISLNLFWNLEKRES